MEDLKTCIRSYRDVDNKLRELNGRVYELRQERRSLEIELGDIVKNPQFDSVHELRINDDGSSIKIQRPGWKKPWGLSKKDLSEHLIAYFKETMNPNPEECMAHIIAEQNKKLVSDDFCFSRVVRDE